MNNVLSMMNLGLSKSLGLVVKIRKRRAGSRKRIVWWLVRAKAKIKDKKVLSF